MRHNIAFHVAFQRLGYHDFWPQQREEVVCRRERCIYHTGGGGGGGGVLFSLQFLCTYQFDELLHRSSSIVTFVSAAL